MVRIFRGFICLVLIWLFVFFVWVIVKPYFAERLVPTVPNSVLRQKEGRGETDDLYIQFERAVRAIKWDGKNAEYYYRLAKIAGRIKDTGDFSVLERIEGDFSVLEWKEGDLADLFFEEETPEDDAGVGTHKDDAGEGAPDTDVGEGTPKDDIREGTPEDDAGERTPEDYDTREAEAARKDDAGMLDRIIEGSLKRAIAMNPVNPFYHFSLGRHYVEMSESFRSEDFKLGGDDKTGQARVDRWMVLLAQAESEFDRAACFFPNNVKLLFSIGSYWHWKSRVAGDIDSRQFAFKKTSEYFTRVLKLDMSYKGRINKVLKS